MLKLILLVALAVAHADPRVGRAQALLNTIWSHVTGRYPALPVKDIRPCRADFLCASINGERVDLKQPSAAFDDLPEAQVIGIKPDGSRPWLLMRTRDEDPTLLWALYDLMLKRLKFTGYDRYRQTLPGDVDPNQIAAASARVANVTLLKYLTTRSAGVLLLTREELSAGLSCQTGFATELGRDLAEIAALVPPTDTMRTRAAELEGVIGILTLNTVDFCEPKRLLMWKQAMIGTHARVEAALADLSEREFPRD